MHSISIEKRRSIKKITEGAKLCLSKKDWATIMKEKVRHFSARARDYNVVYLLLMKNEDQFIDSNTSLKKIDIEKMEKNV